MAYIKLTQVSRDDRVGRRCLIPIAHITFISELASGDTKVHTVQPSSMSSPEGPVGHTVIVKEHIDVVYEQLAELTSV